MWKTYGFPKAIESRKKRGFSRSRSDVYPRVVIQMFGDVWWMFLLFLKYCWWWHVNIWCLPVFCMYVFLCSKSPDFLWKYHGNILNLNPWCEPYGFESVDCQMLGSTPLPVIGAFSRCRSSELWEASFAAASALAPQPGLEISWYADDGDL